MADTFARMKQLVGTTAEWAANDIVLGEGEIGVERIGVSDHRAKCGDGVKTWSQLPYLSGTAAAVDAQVAAAAAHALTATTKASEASASQSAAAASFDAFDDIYLGAKSVPPTVDNDGNALQVGAIYWSIGASQTYVWNGASWNSALGGALSSVNVSFIQSGTGAVGRTSQDKMREEVSAGDFGSGTSAVQSAINSLGAGGGFVRVNRGITYDFASLTVPQNVTLLDEANNRIVFRDAAIEDGSATNLLIRRPVNGATRTHIEPRGYPVGTASKTDWMFDPYQDDSANYRIMNAYTKTYDSSDASTTQGNNGIAVLGVKGVGRHFGVWPSLHFGFSDDGAGGAVPMKMYYFDTSDTVWRTPMKGGWRSGVAVTSGDYMLSANKLYQAGTTATTGATAPTHTSGAVSDGAVSWTFVRDFAAASGSIAGCIVFGNRDDLPKFGLNSVRAQFAADAAVWNGKKIRFLDGSNAPAWDIYTNNLSDDLYIETADGSRRLRLDYTGQFLQIVGLAISGNGVSAPNLSTTPSIKGARTLILSNTSATTITQFADGIQYQEFYVRTANGQTTLEHNANIRLKGGANRTLTADNVLLFQMNSAGTVAFEVG